jgi:hypothetical protein
MTDPTPEDLALLVAVAQRVVRLRMETPAVLFLESVRPLSFVGSQALVFFEPFAQALFHWEQYERFTKLVADRDNLERLTRLIEDEADARDARDKQAKSDAREKGR